MLCGGAIPVSCEAPSIRRFTHGRLKYAAELPVALTLRPLKSGTKNAAPSA